MVNPLKINKSNGKKSKSGCCGNWDIMIYLSI